MHPNGHSSPLFKETLHTICNIVDVMLKPLWYCWKPTSFVILLTAFSTKKKFLFFEICQIWFDVGSSKGWLLNVNKRYSNVDIFLLNIHIHILNKSFNNKLIPEIRFESAIRIRCSLFSPAIHRPCSFFSCPKKTCTF